MGKVYKRRNVIALHGIDILKTMQVLISDVVKNCNS